MLGACRAVLLGSGARLEVKGVASGGASTNTLTLSRPAGVVAGDRIVLFAVWTSGDPQPPASPTFTQHLSQTTGIVAIRMWSATVGAEASYVCTTGQPNGGVFGAVFISGRLPLLAQAHNIAHAAGTNYPAPSLTLSETGLLITAHGAQGNGLYTPYAGGTERVDTDTLDNAVTLSIVTMHFENGGVTGERTATGPDALATQKVTASTAMGA